MITSLINQLIIWEVSSNDPFKLRTILGEILSEINEFSSSYKKAIRNPSPENAQKLQVLKSSIEIGEFLKLQRILNLILQKTSKLKQTDQNSGSKRQLNVIDNLIHTIERSSFNESQVQQIKNSSVYDAAQAPEFPEETNKEGLDQHLKSSIYNTSNESDKTLKVLREVLQNAVDATDPARHPELTNRTDFNPVIKITSSSHSQNGKSYLDLIIEDFGTGMNWDVLSKKFFVTFESGKKDDPHSTGGFGIAKTLIQESPKHGWSIDTNQIHSNRFQKNVYFGTKLGQNYEHPTSQVKKTNSGTTLSLFGLPMVEDYSIENYCQKYATNGRVKIIFNDETITPKFLLTNSDVKPLSYINNLIDVFGDTGSSKEVATNVFDKIKDNLEEKMAGVKDFQSPQTSVAFYVRKTSGSGRLYVMVNGQFQFDEAKFFNKLELICDLQTTAKAGTDEYPLDPGRSKIKGKLGESINSVCKSINEFSDKVGEDTLFKQGIESFSVNATQQPLKSHRLKKKKSELANSILIDLQRGFDPYDDEEPPEQRANKIIDAIERETGTNFSDAETQLANALLQDVLSAKGKDKRITQSDIEKILEGLDTPASILIQKNFVAREWVSQNVALTSDILILWTKILKIITDKITSSKFGRNMYEKEFVPGLIYSDEVNGLYVSADTENGRPYPSVSINPITAASAINPSAFAKKLMSKTGKDAFKTTEIDSDEYYSEEDEDESSKRGSVADTPTNRLAKLLFHIATHELTHLMYPESWEGNYERFHDNVTYIEIFAHDSFNEIRDEVKKHMPSLRRNSAKLITAIAKRAPKTNENYTPKSNKQFTFKNWLYGLDNWKDVIK